MSGELESLESNSEIESGLNDEQVKEELVAEQKAIEKMEREFLIKVNGKEQKTKIDLNDEARIIKALQLEAAAQEAMQERAGLRKQQEEMQNNLAEFISELKSNPLAVLQHEELGVDIRQMVEAYLNNEIERSQKSPEQLELEKAKEELMQLQEEKRLAEEAREAAKREQLEQEAAMELEKEISNVIESGNLPKSKYISQKIVDLAHIAYTNGIDISISDIAPLVKKQYLKDMKEMLGLSSDDIVEELIGKDRVRSIRNKQIQSVKSAPVGNALKTQDMGVSNKQPDSAQRIRAKDFFSKLGS